MLYKPKMYSLEGGSLAKKEFEESMGYIEANDNGDEVRYILIDLSSFHYSENIFYSKIVIEFLLYLPIVTEVHNIAYLEDGDIIIEWQRYLANSPRVKDGSILYNKLSDLMVGDLRVMWVDFFEYLDKCRLTQYHF